MWLWIYLQNQSKLSFSYCDFRLLHYASTFTSSLLCAPVKVVVFFFLSMNIPFWPFSFCSVDQLVENKDSLQSISSDSDMRRFLFYKHVTGVNISTLVSVRYSDYYISTALENNRPVELCQETAPRNRNFFFKRLNKSTACERQLWTFAQVSS